MEYRKLTETHRVAPKARTTLTRCSRQSKLGTCHRRQKREPHSQDGTRQRVLKKMSNSGEMPAMCDHAADGSEKGDTTIDDGIVQDRRRIFKVRFFAWCGQACARGGAATTQKEDPGYVISLRSGKKTPITGRAGSDRITISRSPRRGLTRLAIDGAQHSHDDIRSENHTHKRAPDAGAKAQQERMMAPEARTTLTR
ncbi:unnamed protein product [Trichogramma brassicae]|uniref:Uncharacterized protein n=1 Tax=Trichogramma brassicae TaxID=86971 RepID=A0A6H5J3B2_9HYME|nr:unnamed protein product [Trichogramma brassicae]